MQKKMLSQQTITVKADFIERNKHKMEWEKNQGRGRENLQNVTDEL